MSYILDALKKSEQERGGEDRPEWNQEDLSASSAAAFSDKSKRGTYVALAVLLPVLFGLIYWVFFHNKELSLQNSETQTIANTTADGAQQDDAAGSENVAALDQGDAASNGSNPADAVNAASSAGDASTAGKKKVKKVNLAAFNAAQGRKPGARPVSGKSGNTKTHKNASTQRPSVIFSDKPLDINASDQDSSRELIEQIKGMSIPKPKPVVDVYDLPQDIQNSLPKLLFSGHVYSSDPLKSNVMINDKKLHEGDTAAAGVTVEKITPVGAEFKFKSWRFSIGALQDWNGT